VRITRSILAFLVVAVAFAIPAVIAIVSTGQLELHGWMNRHHPHWADRFFAAFTHVADGLVPTALALLLLAIKDVRSFLMMGLSCGLSAIVVQFLKRSVFADHHRPAMFKEHLPDLNWVEGVELHHHFSFPSGHSTAAFAMCLALAVIINRTNWAAALAFMAVLLAYSRVYLSQHFTEDILAGAALGTMTALLVQHALYAGRLSSKPWMTRRLFPAQNQ
jgi:membrane-associated phospholipid phosphatase